MFEWAKNKGAERYSFMSFPYTNGTFEKHDSFLNTTYSH
ncbi:MAG: glutamine synthetase III [Bdellovibrionales bacterium]|nr:glutamine synthetase III [Bdellovibrionales bacterium]